MKKHWLALGILLSGAYASSAAAGELLLGAKAGLVDYDLPSSDPGINGSFMLGYEFLNLGVADIAVEGELSTSLVDGEVDTPFGSSDLEFESLGAYLSARTAGPIYAIGRVGIVNGEINQTDDTEPAMGIGIGFSTVGLRWELEYTAYEVENVDIDYISLGLSF